MLNVFDLSGRVALVTGAYRGLGFAIAQGLARAGATVVLNGRRNDVLEPAARALARQGLRAITALFDVTDRRVASRAARDDRPKSGKIVHVASVLSDLACPSVVPYTAAKGGVRQLTAAWRSSWRRTTSRSTRSDPATSQPR